MEPVKKPINTSRVSISKLGATNEAVHVPSYKEFLSYEETLYDLERLVEQKEKNPAYQSEPLDVQMKRILDNDKVHREEHFIAHPNCAKRMYESSEKMLATTEVRMQKIRKIDQPVGKAYVDIRAADKRPDTFENRASNKKLAVEKVAADNAAAEKVAADNAAAEKVAMDKELVTVTNMHVFVATAEKILAEKVAAEKVAAEKVAMEKHLAEIAAAINVTVSKLHVAAEKVAAEKLAAEKVAAEKVEAKEAATAQADAQKDVLYGALESYSSPGFDMEGPSPSVDMDGLF